MKIPLNIDWQQILLHLFNFSILVIGLYLLLYKPVKKFMQKREDYYKEMDASAQKDRQEAKALLDQYEKRLADADGEIAEKREQAQAELDQLREQQLSEVRHQADVIMTQARESSAQERKALRAKATKELGSLVVEAAEKIALKEGEDPYEQFLKLAEEEESHAS